MVKDGCHSNLLHFRLLRLLITPAKPSALQMDPGDAMSWKKTCFAADLGHCPAMDVTCFAVWKWSNQRRDLTVKETQIGLPCFDGHVFFNWGCHPKTVAFSIFVFLRPEFELFWDQRILWYLASAGLKLSTFSAMESEQPADEEAWPWPAWLLGSLSMKPIINIRIQALLIDLIWVIDLMWLRWLIHDIYGWSLCQVVDNFRVPQRYVGDLSHNALVQC